MQPKATSGESSTLTLEDVDREALWNLIVYGVCPLPNSIIPPKRPYPFWKELPKRTFYLPKQDYYGKFLQQVCQAVDTVLVSVPMRDDGWILEAQPIGIWLSGGVDSSTLLWALSTYHQREPWANMKAPRKLKAYYLSFGVANNELEEARRVAKHFDITLVTQELSVEEAIDHIPHTIFNQRAPIDALAVRPLAKLCAEDGIHHCFSALGMDELMGGYPVHVQADDRDYTVIEDAQLWHCQSYYVWINQTHSQQYVHVHFPFLDPTLVNYARNLPRDHKTRGTDTKFRLREELLRFTDIPYENVMAGREVGSKGGFTPYLEDWWGKGLGEWCDDHFPTEYFTLLDQAKLKLARKFQRNDLNHWVRLRCATAKVFLDLVTDGAFTV